MKPNTNEWISQSRGVAIQRNFPCGGEKDIHPKSTDRGYMFSPLWKLTHEQQLLRWSLRSLAPRLLPPLELLLSLLLPLTLDVLVPTERPKGSSFHERSSKKGPIEASTKTCLNRLCNVLLCSTEASASTFLETVATRGTSCK